MQINRLKDTPSDRVCPRHHGADSPAKYSGPPAPLRLEATDGGSYELHDVEAGDPANFLADPAFVHDFGEVFRYYKDTRLVQLRRLEGRLLAVFQTGRAAGDLKVFRWALEREFDIVVEMDADGSHRPEELPDVLEAFADRKPTVAVSETRLPGAKSHLVMPVTHTGLVWSAAVADQVAAFLKRGKFDL